MRCPRCQAQDTRVIDTRVIEEGISIRRRRECPKCGFRFSTTEEIEILSLNVQKIDGRLELYDKEKLTRSIRLPLEKRAIPPAKFKRMVHSIEQEIQTKVRKDTITSSQIGEIIMRHLRRADKIAYIRFASVYRQFEDVEEFADELKKLSRKRKPVKKAKK